MGVFGRKQPGGGRPAYGGGGGHVKRPWVVAAEGFFIRLFSFAVSCASAYSIAQVYAPPGASISRVIEGYVLSVTFAGIGFFVSRGIAYRMMVKESIGPYVGACLIVELVEVYCNYVVGVHDLNLGMLLRGIPASQDGFLTVMGCVVVSCIPAMVLSLAALEMDFEKRKVIAGSAQPKAAPLTAYGGSAQPKATPVAAYTSQAGQAFNNAATQPVQKIQRSVRPVPQQAQGGASTNGANPPLQGVTAP